MTLTTTHEIGATVVTPTIRRAGRATRFWIIAAISLVVVAVLAIILSGSAQPEGASLSSTDAGPGGSKALAQVLRNHGVTVTATSSMPDTRDAITAASDTTIFLVDDNGYLDADSLRELERISSHLIVMSPNFDALDVVAPQVALAGHVDGTLAADCALPVVERAENVTGTGTGFRVIGSDSGVTSCLGSGDDIYSLVEVRDGADRLTVLGTRDAFSNQFVQFDGNAAFALGLLGETRNLVWMLPTIADAPTTATIAELTPAWVSAVMALLILSAVAAGFWRGRRFGPLVVEALPVTVRSSETMRGRARLYENASAQLHALDALRMGAIDRLSKLSGLPRAASVEDVIRAVARATGRDGADIARLLRDAKPAGDAEFIALSDALLELEAATAAATRPTSATIDTTRSTTTKPEGLNT